MSIDALTHLSILNRELLIERQRLQREVMFDPSKIIRWRPCAVRVLIVTDGIIDYDPLNDFSLSVFVSSLLSSPSYVRFAITLAHISDIGVGSLRMMTNESRITRRIVNFKFDNGDHFSADKYDVVFLFGIATSYGRGAGYPADSLSNAELQQLAAFQNGGGGLFATGDHGDLGRPLCHKVARARDMRLWQSTPNQLGEDKVSMGGRFRNDTNRPGRDAAGGPGGSDFDDQSDDIPQTISPVFYTRQRGLFRYSFPHPLLCGPDGAIRVMPDHAHEGECKRPGDLDLTLSYTASVGLEYPPATNGGARPVPEIIAYNSVLAGTTSSGKAPAVAQSFPSICAYDGHRAGVGRVVTDATWHHFVNVNLTGMPGVSDGAPSGWGLGFLRSPAGQAALENIKSYYRNLAVWLSPPERIQCMNSRLLWHVMSDGRVLESVLTTRSVGIERVNVRALSLIGRHARDVLGRFVSRCQSQRIILDLIADIPDLVAQVDPWDPVINDKDEEGDDLPLFDLTPMLDAALGGSLVMLNEQFPDGDVADLEKLRTEEVLGVARKGAGVALQRARQSLQRSLREAGSTLLNER